MKKVIFFIVIVLLLVAIPVTVYFIGKQQDIRSKAAPATTIQLTPQTLTKQVDDSFSMDVVLNTGSNSIASVKIQLLFDATALEAESITNGPLAPNIAVSGVVGQGSAGITVSAANTATPITGTGTVAVVRFKAKGATTVPTTVRFDSTTYASAFGETQNALISSVPATITITGPAVTAITTDTTGTPTPTPTGTTTTTPTVTTTISPTPTGAVSATTATGSAALTGSNTTGVTITTPQDGQLDVPTVTPTIEGTAPAGATITLTIDPPQTTTTVTADATGHWVYIADILAVGKHTVTATAVTADGTTSVTSITFTIPKSAVGTSYGGIGGGSEMPTTGSITTTVVLVVSAIWLVVFGIALPH